MEHHLYSLSPLTSLSVDRLSPLKEDEKLFVIVVDKFLKLIGLYPAKNTTFKEHVHALL